MTMILEKNICVRRALMKNIGNKIKDLYGKIKLTES